MTAPAAYNPRRLAFIDPTATRAPALLLPRSAGLPPTKTSHPRVPGPVVRVPRWVRTSPDYEEKRRARGTSVCGRAAGGAAQAEPERPEPPPAGYSNGASGGRGSRRGPA